jgi:hypothetical protein
MKKLEDKSEYSWNKKWGKTGCRKVNLIAKKVQNTNIRISRKGKEKT